MPTGWVPIEGTVNKIQQRAFLRSVCIHIGDYAHTRCRVTNAFKKRPTETITTLTVGVVGVRRIPSEFADIWSTLLADVKHVAPADRLPQKTTKAGQFDISTSMLLLTDPKYHVLTVHGLRNNFPNTIGVQPRKDGLGTPPFLGFFYSYTLGRHPKTLNTNTAPSMHLLWGTLGPGLVMPNFGCFWNTPFWARTPLGTPLPGQEGGFLGGFLGRNPPLPRPLPGQEPPFLDPSYDPSCPEAIAHKSFRWGLNRMVPPH